MAEAVEDVRGCESAFIVLEWAGVNILDMGGRAWNEEVAFPSGEGMRAAGCSSEIIFWWIKLETSWADWSSCSLMRMRRSISTCRTILSLSLCASSCMCWAALALSSIDLHCSSSSLSSCRCRLSSSSSSLLFLSSRTLTWRSLKWEVWLPTHMRRPRMETKAFSTSCPPAVRT